ncbi:MAG: 3-isopropylmalate dehydratase small subunit [Vampirovibrionales bacterium]|nr:3-isopropylmalate dehydratase small subunit [Vampirovibrionales bacterium]
MTTQPIQHISGPCLALPVEQSDNIDTDQIIAARFLKGTVKTDLGQNLFYDWRYDDDGALRPGFVLNQPEAKQARVLVARHNFGCGSSREHAPWALRDFGFQAVLAVSFADIFKNNALKNRVLPLVLPEALIHRLQTALAQTEPVTAEISIADKTITLNGPSVNETLGFEMNSFWQTCWLEGVDEIGYSLRFNQQILEYEAAYAATATRSADFAA